MTKTQLGTQLNHHMIMEMGPIISEYGLWNSKTIYDVIEKEEGDSLTILCICRHGLSRFCEIIHGYDDVTMPPG